MQSQSCIVGYLQSCLTLVYLRFITMENLPGDNVTKMETWSLIMYICIWNYKHTLCICWCWHFCIYTCTYRYIKHLCKTGVFTASQFPKITANSLGERKHPPPSSSRRFPLKGIFGCFFVLDLETGRERLPKSFHRPTSGGFLETLDFCCWKLWIRKNPPSKR